MVQASRRLGVRFQWVNADGGYGKEPRFLRTLDAWGEQFMVDVHQDQHVYLDNPEPFVPASTPGRGRKRSRLQARVKPIPVQRWLESQPECAWSRQELRHSTKGVLEVEVIHRRIWLWDGSEPQAHEWHLGGASRGQGAATNQVQREQRAGRYLDATLGVRARTTILGRAFLPRRQESRGHG